MPSFQDEYDLIYENKVIPDGLPISWLMSQLDLSDITRTIEKKYYCKNLHEYFHYPVDFMIKLIVVMTYRKIAYRHVRSKITKEDITYLLPSKTPFLIPSSSTIHHFVKYRLGEEGMELLMYLIGKKIAHFMKGNEDGIVDSTPLAASRYSSNSLFNPHYEIKMDKAHILHFGTYPLFMIHTGGNANDKPYGEQLIEIARMMNIHPKRVLMDGGYDSFEMHTLIFEKLGATPVIGLRYDAVIAKTASEKSILQWANKFWKQGGADCKSFKDKLLFLAKTKKREIVGQYLRNQTIKNLDVVNEILKNRAVCERKHAHIKNTVKFDVVGYRRDNRNLYSMVNFITFQLMNLAHLQNDFQNKTSFAGYR